jgi:hypothetical protein
MNFALLKDPALLLAAAFYSVLLTIAMQAGLLGLWLGLLLVLSIWRYSYELLRAAAQGRHELPAPAIETMNPVAEFRLLVHFIAFPALLTLLTIMRGRADGVPAELALWVLTLVVVFAAPASAAMMGITSHLEGAFSPANIVRVVRIAGRDYFLLVALCVVLFVVAQFVNLFLMNMLGFFAGFLCVAVEVWTMLSMFTLTGAVLHAHRNDFDIPGELETSTEAQARWERGEWRKTLDLAYGSIRSGLVAEGYATLRKLTAQHGESLDVQYWLFDNMLEWEDRRHALEIGKRLVERHVAEGDLMLAVELFTRCRRIDASFSIRAREAAALATFARSIGRKGVADELTAGG